MANEWPTVSLGELAAPIRNALVGGPFGSDLTKRDYTSAGVPVIRGENMRSRWIGGPFAYVSVDKADSLSGNLARPGDLVFTQRGTLGQVAMVPHGRSYDRYLVSQSQMKVTPDDEKADVRFLYYYFASAASLEYFRQHAIQTGVPHTNLGILRATPVVLPPLPVQQRIADVLGKLDDKIELNRRMNRTLEKMAAAIFKSWFIDFDPVHAKAEGRDPNLPAEIADLLPDGFEDSELGAIPKGWSVGPLAELAELETKSVKPGNEPEAFWEHYSIPAYDEGQQPHRDLGETIKSGKYAVPELSVLVSKLNPRLPRTWLPHVTDPARAICSTEFMPFVACSDHWRPFIYEMMKSYPVQDAIKAHATGSTGSRQRVKPKEIAELSVIAPPPNVIDAFSDMTGPLHDRILLNRRQTRRLAGLRDTLLPKLLSGEIELPEAGGIVEEVFT